MDTYNQAGLRSTPHGVEAAATGSLGHGLPLGVGMALAGRIHKHALTVLSRLSDGQ